MRHLAKAITLIILFKRYPVRARTGAPTIPTGFPWFSLNPSEKCWVSTFKATSVSFHIISNSLFFIIIGGRYIVKLLAVLKDRDSSVSIATGYGFDFQEGQEIFSSPQHPDQLCSQPNLLSNGCREHFQWR
jgi:hypothetical protein